MLKKIAIEACNCASEFFRNDPISLSSSCATRTVERERTHAIKYLKPCEGSAKLGREKGSQTGGLPLRVPGLCKCTPNEGQRKEAKSDPPDCWETENQQIERGLARLGSKRIEVA